MIVSSQRRTYLLAAAALLGTRGAAARAQSAQAAPPAHGQLVQLENNAGGRLGVAAFRHGGSASLLYRGDELFPMCSTFKMLLAGAILGDSARDANLLPRRIRYGQADMVDYAPVTEQHMDTGMTVAELRAAALQYSDNVAGNLLLKLAGGPAGLTAYARSIGDSRFRLDRWETALNTALPGDPRDTTTPAAMAHTLDRLVLGELLPPPQREQLQLWLRGNTTGDTRIRAGAPAGWSVGDKTGSGAHGTANDVGVLWPPSGAPIVLVVFYTQEKPDAPKRNDVLAAVTRIVGATL